jgi:hypothetical protein
MNLDRVKYKKGRACVEYIIKTGRQRGQVDRQYGEIVTCQECGKKTFSSSCHLNIGWGKFCSLKCAGRLENHSNWNGGRFKHPKGYILVKSPNHPFVDDNNYVPEHRLIVERQIGRYLHRWEIVHHVNKVRDDNRPEKLMAFKSKGDHSRFHCNPDTVKPEDIIFDGRKLEKAK